MIRQSPLTPAKRNMVAEHMQEKQIQCPYCRRDDQRWIFTQSPGYMQLVPMTCAHCGSVLWLDFDLVLGSSDNNGSCGAEKSSTPQSPIMSETPPANEERLDMQRLMGDRALKRRGRPPKAKEEETSEEEEEKSYEPPEDSGDPDEL